MPDDPVDDAVRDAIRARRALDMEMRAVLTQLAVCSHAPAAGAGSGGSSDESLGGGRPPGDNALEYYERSYGPPFHSCDPGCRHTVTPARDDARRRVIIGQAKAQLDHLRGYAPAQRPAGETEAQLDKRILKTGVGFTVEEVATACRTIARRVIRVRTAAAVNVHDGRDPEPAADAAERRARVVDLHGQGMTISQIAFHLSASASTIKRDLRHRDQRRAA